MKSKLKNVLLMGLSLVLVAAIAIGGTVAYLTDTDSDVNVMTVGNVSIRQNEQQRDENGNLVDFRQGQSLLPAVYDGDSLPYTEEVTVGGLTWEVCDQEAGAVDKIITVTNTGSTAAYIRTLVAFEDTNDVSANLHIRTGTYGDSWSLTYPQENGKYVQFEKDGATYTVGVFTYAAPLDAGATSVPSLLQVYLDKSVDNEIMEIIGDEYTIIALSQATQAAGFKDAATALDTSFGAVTTANATIWFGGVSYAYTYEDLTTALAMGGEIKLGADIVLEADDYMSITSKGHQRRLLIQDVTATLDLNGHTISVDGGGYTIYVNGDSNLIVRDSIGTGAIISNSDDRMMGINGNAYVTIESGVFKNTRTEVCGYNGFSTWGNSTLKIYGGTFDIPSAGKGDGSGLQWLLHNYNGRYQGSAIGIEVFGGKFVNHDLSKGTAGTNYYGDRFDLVNPAYECVKTGVDENGNTWYEVVAK